MRFRFAFLIVFCFVTAASAAEPMVVPVWPEMDKALVAKESSKDRGSTTQPNRFISEIAYPTMTIALPPKEKASGVAIVICPGGGYSGVAIDKEGFEVARWLNSIGHGAIILKYRMPQVAETKDGKPLPLIDAQRAIRYVRSQAQELNIDPAKVGIMGFSAGGHLASTVATHFDAIDANAADPIDRLSDRPDFVVLLYPVITMRGDVAHTGSRKHLLGDAPDPAMEEKYSNELQVTAQTPPTFLVHAKDDKVKCENSILFHDALDKTHVPNELHLLEKGGHGFGLGAGKAEASTWPGLCEKWISGVTSAPAR